MSDFQKLKTSLLRDPQFKEEYDALELRYEIISQLISARIKNGLTQSQVAKRSGTTQSAIARLEGGVSNPSLDLLGRVCAAMGWRIELKPIAYYPL